VDVDKIVCQIITQSEALLKVLKRGDQPNTMDYILTIDLIYRFLNSQCATTSFIIEPNDNTQSWLLS